MANDRGPIGDGRSRVGVGRVGGGQLEWTEIERSVHARGQSRTTNGASFDFEPDIVYILRALVPVHIVNILRALVPVHTA